MTPEEFKNEQLNIMITIFNKYKAFRGAVLLLDQNNNTHYAEIEGMDKDFITNMYIPMIIQKIKPVALLVINEAWLSESEEYERPSLDPNRKEAIIYQFETDSTNEIGNYFITRKGNKVTLSEPEVIVNPSINGRYSNLLSKSKINQN